MDFTNHLYFIWHVFGQDVWITQTIVFTWCIMAVLILFAVIVRIKLNRFKQVPTGFQNLVELMVDTMDNFVKSSMGEENASFGNYFFGVFAFILVSNLSGMIGLRPPTADLATTAALALTTFVLIHYMGIKRRKLDYFKGYLKPIPVFLPIHLIGELARPVSLSFRLFGNILGGFIIMGLVYGLLPIFVKIVIPSVLHGYFDVFAGCLQAFIFTVLSMTFIRSMMEEEA